MTGPKQREFLAAEKYFLAFDSAHKGAIGTLISEYKFTTTMLKLGMVAGNQVTLDNPFPILAAAE